MADEQSAGNERNAAIWYASDGYDPQRGINGRRVAGASFLNGFFRHAEVPEFVSASLGDKTADDFAKRLAATGRKIPHRRVYLRNLRRLAPVGTVSYPSPCYENLLWRRQSTGMESYSICGITHTTDTQGIMQGVINLRSGPQAEWDGMICTSRAVHAAYLRNMEIADAFLRDRFGRLPPRPQMPVIPLGLHCDDFEHDPAARDALRARMGWTEDDIAVVTVARLLPFGKFDPGPLFIALQHAQEILGTEKRLHFIACGLYGDKYCKDVFEGCAQAFMPDVSFHHLDGGNAELRNETRSGGDIFAFAIDHLQETFGLAPIEAMAAGLPVVVSDWDGMKDTVPPEVGFRIPTLGLRAPCTRPEADGYLNYRLNYRQYGSNLSAMAVIDLKGMTDAFVSLARDAGLRRRMGEAGRRRARSVYDWAEIIPQIQDFWAELSHIRMSCLRRDKPRARFNPVGPLPMDLFSGYPSALFRDDDAPFAACCGIDRLQVIYRTRRYRQLKEPFERLDTLERIFGAVSAAGAAGSSVREVSRALAINPVTVERSWMFFLKYGLIAPVTPQTV